MNTVSLLLVPLLSFSFVLLSFVSLPFALKELLELKQLGVEIVYINYERPMGYELNYWYKKDIIK